VKPFRVGLAGLIVAGLAVSCSTSEPDLAVVVGEAPERTSAAGTAKIYERVSVTLATDDTFDVTFEGETDFENGRTHLTGSVLGQPAEIVLDGTALYQRFEGLEGLTRGKPWLRIDVGESGGASLAGGMSSTLGGQPTDPAQGLRMLEGASGEVTTVGDERVRGVDTTHYRVPVDIEQAVSEAPPRAQPGLRRMLDRLGVEVLVEVWLDDDGLARRYRQVVGTTGANAPAGGGGGSEPAVKLPLAVETTVELYDFGSPVEIAVPPADEVADLSEILGDDESAPGPVDEPATNRLAGLIGGAPIGYAQEPDDVAGTGPLSLDQAVDYDGGADARQVLTSAGFVAGFQRKWLGRYGPIAATMYEFTDPAGAVAYGSRLLADSLGSAASSSTFVVAGLPSLQGFLLPHDDGPANLVHFTKDNYLVEMVGFGDEDVQEIVSDLAAETYDRL